MLPKISFCVTCKNRWYQLKVTLSHNLPLLNDHEIVVVNYGSEDNMHSEMSEFSRYMESGTLRYFYTSDPKNFHASKAKNLAHRLATSEFLFNLDGDNYLDIDFINELVDLFSNFPFAVIHGFRKDVYVAGTYGRIGMHRNNFLGIGGYNEGFLPMGFQDEDLILRLNFLGVPYIATRKFPPPPIFNSIQKKADQTSKIGGVESYRAYREMNKNFSYLLLSHVGPVLESNFSSYTGLLNFKENVVINGCYLKPDLFLPEDTNTFSSRRYRSARLIDYQSFLVNSEIIKNSG